MIGKLKEYLTSRDASLEHYKRNIVKCLKHQEDIIGAEMMKIILEEEYSTYEEMRKILKDAKCEYESPQTKE